MFDWNDEELRHIIWGETCQSDDHIVPYPNGSERKDPALYENNIKEWDVEAANKPSDLKKPSTKTDLSNVKVESSSKGGTDGSPLRFDSKAGLSLSRAIRDDQGSLVTQACNNLAEMTKHECSRGATSRLDDSRIIQHHREDREQGDLIDYGWASIGNFDDLDKILSNDDPIFGDTSLSNTDELWSSSKDVLNSPDKSTLSIDSPSLGLGSLRSMSEKFEVKAEYMLDNDQSFTGGYEKLNDATSNHSQTASEMGGIGLAFNSQINTGTSATPSRSFNKGNNQKKLLKDRIKSEQEGERCQLHESCKSWSPTLNKFCMPYTPISHSCPVSLLSHGRQLQGPESLHYKHIPNPLITSSIYGDMENYCSASPVLSQFHSGEESHQSVPSSYGASPGNSNHVSKSQDAPSKPLTMTPQEKIEKLRRRQQMRAMLAIQKQQQQFSNQIVSSEQSAVEGGTIESEDNLNTIPPLDPSSLLEHDDSTIISMDVEDSSVEDSILYHLHDVISKLDIRIRRCMRDSLFRLAQSATQRQCANNVSSTKNGGKTEASQEEINTNKRIARLPNVEAETNPIDRVVAHLLFHRPPEFTANLNEIPQSSMSGMLHNEQNTIGSLSSPRRSIPRRFETRPASCYQAPKTPASHNEVDQFKSSPGIESFENASNNEGADGVVIGDKATP